MGELSGIKSTSEPNRSLSATTGGWAGDSGRSLFHAVRGDDCCHLGSPEGRRSLFAPGSGSSAGKVGVYAGRRRRRSGADRACNGEAAADVLGTVDLFGSGVGKYR